MRISEHISYEEGMKSITAIRNKIDNTPTPEHLLNMKLLAEKVFEPLRKGLGDRPINIAIFYRCKELNKLIKGASPNSQHMTGQAIDLDNDGYTDCPTNEEIFNYIKDNLDYDQLINEYDFSWVHVSYKLKGNRKQIIITT